MKRRSARRAGAERRGRVLDVLRKLLLGGGTGATTRCWRSWRSWWRGTASWSGGCEGGVGDEEERGHRARRSSLLLLDELTDEQGCRAEGPDAEAKPRLEEAPRSGGRREEPPPSSRASEAGAGGAASGRQPIWCRRRAAVPELRRRAQVHRARRHRGDRADPAEVIVRARQAREAGVRGLRRRDGARARWVTRSWRRRARLDAGGRHCVVEQVPRWPAAPSPGGALRATRAAHAELVDGRPDHVGHRPAAVRSGARHRDVLARRRDARRRDGPAGARQGRAQGNHARRALGLRRRRQAGDGAYLYTSTGKKIGQRPGEIGPEEMLELRAGLRRSPMPPTSSTRASSDAELIEVGCNMHARRYFIKAMDADDMRAAAPHRRLQGALRRRDERARREPDERLAARRRESKPVYDELSPGAARTSPTSRRPRCSARRSSTCSTTSVALAATSTTASCRSTTASSSACTSAPR